MAIWNDKSNYLIKNCLPLRAWRFSCATSSIGWPRSEGLNIYWIPKRLSPPYSCVQLYIWSYLTEICNTSHWSATNQSIDRAPVVAVNLRCHGVDMCSTQVCAYSSKTITAIALWRHNSGPWDKAASIAAHNNVASRTMAFTLKCWQHYHIGKTKWYEYHIRKTKCTDMQTT